MALDIIMYKAYQLNQTPKGEYQPSLKQQLEEIKKSFSRIYGVEPDNLLIGPIKKGEQIIVPKGQVYIQIPEMVGIRAEGYEFTTGYDTKNTT